MNPRGLARSIRRSWDAVSKMELGRSFSMPTSLNIDTEFRDLLFDKEAYYDEIYLLGLRKSHYNFILNDFSYFQFSLFDASMRFAFFPNPFDFKDDDITYDDLDASVEQGILSFEEYAHLVSDSRLTGC